MASSPATERRSVPKGKKYRITETYCQFNLKLWVDKWYVHTRAMGFVISPRRYATFFVDEVVDLPPQRISRYCWDMTQR